VSAPGCADAGTASPGSPRRPAKAASSPPTQAPGAWQSTVVGHSVRGRPIRAYHTGPPNPVRTTLVVGCVHGNEPAGEAITRRLRRTVAPSGTALWVVDVFNPDGRRANTRQNAHGVDLNRNSPWHWRPLDRPGGTYYSGPRPLSEPESRAINRLVERIHPNVSIWYHQHARLVDDSAGNRAVEADYARRVGLPLGKLGPYPGSITDWQDAMFPGDTAFVVELPAGRLSRRSVARHVAAVLALTKP